MTQDEIISMARNAGLLDDDEAWVSPHQEAMERFAVLVAAHEREACAKVCDEAMIQMNYSEAPYKQCAAAIRARGEK